MSWGGRKPKVELRVTRFLPEVAPATPAGLTDEQRAAHRERREKETRKPDIPPSEADAGFDEPEDYRDYTADLRSDYADSVGMPLHERMR